MSSLPPPSSPAATAAADAPAATPFAARPDAGVLGRAVLVAGLCAALGLLALRHGRIDEGPALLWLPAGIALGALLSWGRSMAGAVAAGLLAAHLLAGESPTSALLLAAGETAAPWLGAAWLSRQRFQAGMPGVRDARLLSAAVVGSAALAAAWHALMWAVHGDDSLSALAAGYLAGMGAAAGGLLGCLPWLGRGSRLPSASRPQPPAVDPAGPSTLAPSGSPAHAAASTAPMTAAVAAPEPGTVGLAGSCLLAVATLAAGWGAWLGTAPLSAAQASLVFMPPVLLAWMAARGAGRWASATLGVLAIGALLTLEAGHGPFGSRGDRGHALLLLWGYLACCGLLVLIVQSGAAELRRVKSRWRLALEAADVGVADWDLTTGRGVHSPRWQALLGTADAAGPSSLPPPQAWLAQVHADDRNREREALQRLHSPGEDAYRHDLRLKTATGWGWFHVQMLVAERDGRGAPSRLIATLADIGDRRANEERQRLSARLFQHLHEGLLITDADLRVLDVNPTYSQIMGVSRHELLGTVPPLLAAARAGTPSGDPAAAATHGSMWASLRATGTWRGEVVDRRRNGDPCALQVTITAVLGPDSQPRYHVLVISDITEQHLQRQRLERQALFDELTRLPNRARLAQMLADAMASADREGTLLAVCYLDLDHFKPVNDRFGHAAGDRLLVELAHRLRGALRSNAAWSDAAARLGGDEFVLLLRAGTLDEARLAVERVLRVISQPYAIEPGAEPVTVTASVGATVYPLDRSDADTLLRHADHAMYGAKQSGRNGYSFFDPEHSRRTEERVMAIGRVQEALDNHELELYYQPKVDMRRGTVLGMEALLRWNHPEHGVISPAQFLPLIEHTGLSARVGDWVLGQALEQLARWQRQGLDLSVSVNVSARHLQEADFAQRLAEMLARHARPLGERLELEVLETAALADIDYTSALLERCRRLGVRFSLDDFGTGYSTLTYLKRLPVDVLKIDRSFVRNMLDDRQDLAIVEGVIGLARTFGCSVVAEGVEMPAQARLLIDMGCDIGQGHGIASPMRAPAVLAWVTAYRGLFTVAPAAEGPPPPQVA
ncbi:putative bifunctional diguanylate cyclase/phosphodiesterase [Aquincola tertiaricarbonis]|uniref:putative bifunctional diguanylate cyclase/phosphodiesterase n=1 Tax=Aquincola tertiaricarbonis TaxID=391953 RepID=UPI001E496C81|nr:GGDEF domain-containing phosphodiesterase [Aquincola tertiaricarbonis]